MTRNYKLFWLSLIPAVLFSGWFGSSGGWIASFTIIWYGLLGLLFSYLWFVTLNNKGNQDG